MMRASLGFALLGILAAGCAAGQRMESATQPEVTDSIVELEVVTTINGVQGSTARVLLDGQVPGTVKLGLADGRKPVITLGVTQKDAGMVVAAALGGEQSELSDADAKPLARGETLTLHGEGEWEGIVVAITHSLEDGSEG